VQAEAFAALVLMDFVSIAGATQTIVTLLKKPDNRCAAITMLGKTIELCSDQVRASSGSGVGLTVGQGVGLGWRPACDVAGFEASNRRSVAEAPAFVACP
jgi:hypothetical protein